MSPAVGVLATKDACADAADAQLNMIRAQNSTANARKRPAGTGALAWRTVCVNMISPRRGRIRLNASAPV
jgi:hypothetical protein